MHFWTYRLQKTWLDKCLKSPVWEDSATSNVVNRPKLCWNLNHSTFTIFTDPCEGNSGWKSLCDWYAKFYDCLLTHWLPMTSILFLTEVIYCNIFRCNFLRIERYFPNFLFFLHSRSSHSILKFSTKRWPDSWCIFELTDSEKRG